MNSGTLSKGSTELVHVVCLDPNLVHVRLNRNNAILMPGIHELGILKPAGEGITANILAQFFPDQIPRFGNTLVSLIFVFIFMVSFLFLTHRVCSQTDCCVMKSAFIHLRIFVHRPNENGPKTQHSKIKKL
jgi:hypothetical protein